MVVIRTEMNTGTGFRPANLPLNWKSIQLNALFTEKFNSASINSNALEFTGDEAKKLNKYIQGGLNGTTAGIGEAPGYRMSLGNELIFDGGINLGDQSATFECDKIVSPLIEKGNIDYFMTKAEGFDFATLKGLAVGKPGRILDTDYKFIPYCITEIPNYTQVMLLSISAFMMTKELISTVLKIKELVQELIGRIIAGGMTLGLTLVMVIVMLIEIIAYFAYLVLLLIAIIKMLKEIFDNILQKKKWKLGMLIRDLFKRGCEHMGYSGFNSTIFTDPNSKYYNATILPRKIVMPDYTNNLLTGIFDRPEDENQLNGKVYGYEDGVFAQFVRNMMSTYNAEIKVINNVVHFERLNHWNNVQAFQIPNTNPPGYNRNLPDPHQTNFSEVSMNYFVGFRTDETDRNTLNRYRGTTVSVSMVPIITNDLKLQVTKKATSVDIPYAHARRKETFTPIEAFLNNVVQQVFGFGSGQIGTLLNGLYSKINQALSVVSGQNPGSLNFNLSQAPNVINDRIGWLALSQDSTGVPKMFIGTPINPFKLPTFGIDWEVSPINESMPNGSPGIMNAWTFLNEFHGENLLTRGNQWLLYKDRKIKFCLADWKKIRLFNVLKTPDNKNGKFEKINWSIPVEEATVDYRIKQLYTNNYKEMISIDGQKAA